MTFFYFISYQVPEMLVFIQEFNYARDKLRYDISSTRYSTHTVFANWQLLVAMATFV